MQTAKLWRWAMALVFLFVVAAPTAVFAMENRPDKHHVPSVVYQEEGEETHTEEEEVTGQAGGSGVTFVLALIVGIIALIIFVVAILGAVGLGIIGIGYASTSTGEE
jgi:hypothetical protein